MLPRLSSAAPPAPTPPRADLRRSVHLYRAFRVEQTDPARFYGTLARDSVRALAAFTELRGAVLLDVGGGPGFFRDAFEDAGASYLSVDADAGELTGRGEPGPRSLLGSALALPLRDDAVDVSYSSNVLEHVSDPPRMLDEMVRVTRPGGTVFCAFTLWYGPWGGHETAPWHYFGGHRAARRYERRHGRPPKNQFGSTMYAVRAGDALRWARGRPGADLVAAYPRYLPSWAHGVVRVPVVREVAAWNLALVLRVR